MMHVFNDWGNLLWKQSEITAKPLMVKLAK